LINEFHHYLKILFDLNFIKKLIKKTLIFEKLPNKRNIKKEIIKTSPKLKRIVIILK
jgi:hypothetical protein